MIEKSKVACFSGHRILPKDCTEIQSELESAVRKLIEQGVVFFGTGGHWASICLQRKQY